MFHKNMDKILKKTYAFDKKAQMIWKNLTNEAKEMRGILNTMGSNLAELINLTTRSLEYAIDEEKSQRKGKFKLAVKEEKQEVKAEKRIRKSLNNLEQNTKELLKLIKKMKKQDKLEIKLSKKIEKEDYIEERKY